jgi:hypothetical protein
MSYYGSDIDTTESAFDDPSEELEIQAEADDPDGDMGDGLRRQKKLASLDTIDYDPRARRTAKGF